jgi:hypothetical protein
VGLIAMAAAPWCAMVSSSWWGQTRFCSTRLDQEQFRDCAKDLPATLRQTERAANRRTDRPGGLVAAQVEET